METINYMQMCADLGSGYSQIRPLGEGGMGTLYLAHKDTLDVNVVIKCVKQKFKGRLDERAEANILKQLKHKYLPRIYDIIESSSGYIYTIMDYIRGENMQKYIEKHGPADQKLAYRWACQLCEVIDYLHSQTPPILHCDVKPSNIMITPNGDICLIDFNTSLVFSRGVLAIGATPGYAAPEQYTRPSDVRPVQTATAPAYAADETYPLEATMPLGGYSMAQQQTYAPNAQYGTNSTYGGTGSRSMASSLTAAQATGAGGYGTVSKRTDVYGIGATLYYAVTGEKPNHALKEVRPLTSYKLSLSRTFQAIIVRSMRKRQEERFGDAHEMLRALQDIHEMDSRYKSVTTAQVTLTIISIVVLVIGIVLVALGVSQIHKENDAAYDLNIRSARTAGEAAQYEQAQEYIKEAVAIYDTRLEAYYEQAVLYYRMGRYEECINEINNIFERPISTTDAQAWANVCYVAANSWYNLKDYAKAALWYKEAIKYSPNEAYYRDCAISYAAAGDTAAAEQMLSEMTAAYPQAAGDANYQMVLAQIYRKQGNTADALDEILQVIDESKDEELLGRAYVMAAQIYEEMDESYLSDEISVLEKGIDELPGYYSVLSSYLGLAYAKQADALDDESYTEKALDIFETIRDKGMSTFDVRMNIAVLQEKLKHYDDSLATLLELAEESENYQIYKRLTYVELEIETQSSSGNFTKAKEYYKKAVELYERTGTTDVEMSELQKIMEDLG